MSLRLTDFNEKGGWAANGRLTTKLADLGIIYILRKYKHSRMGKHRYKGPGKR